MACQIPICVGFFIIGNSFLKPINIKSYPSRRCLRPSTIFLGDTFCILNKTILVHFFFLDSSDILPTPRFSFRRRIIIKQSSTVRFSICPPKNYLPSSLAVWPFHTAVIHVCYIILHRTASMQTFLDPKLLRDPFTRTDADDLFDRTRNTSYRGLKLCAVRHTSCRRHLTVFVFRFRLKTKKIFSNFCF